MSDAFCHGYAAKVWQARRRVPLAEYALSPGAGDC